MKKTLHILLAITFICFNSSVYSMDSNNSQITIPQLSKDPVIHIAGYCMPKGKNRLMRTCKAFCAYVKDRISVLAANPFTASMPDKIEDMITLGRSGNTEMIEFLLKHGVQAICSNILGAAPFYAASN